MQLNHVLINPAQNILFKKDLSQVEVFPSECLPRYVMDRKQTFAVPCIGLCTLSSKASTGNTSPLIHTKMTTVVC